MKMKGFKIVAQLQFVDGADVADTQRRAIESQLAKALQKIIEVHHLNNVNAAVIPTADGVIDDSGNVRAITWDS